jgi:hypothetical protein
MATEPCQCGWEALRADPLPWLLDEQRPNLRWRVLVELVGRPADSPVVVQARSGAHAIEPLASLLEDLLPDGSWDTAPGLWSRYAGPGWRVIAAAQWGADPADPRMHAAVERLLDQAPGHGGFAPRVGKPESLRLTARLVQAAAELGWGRHLRVCEGLAWLAEQEVGDPVTAVATLAAITAAGDPRPPGLAERAVESLVESLQRIGARARLSKTDFAHPNLLESGAIEGVWALARAGVDYDPRLRRALALVQAAADSAGFWPLRRALPASLPVDGTARQPLGAPSPWLTLRAVVGLLAYAAPAALPRLFPSPPG